MNNSFCLIATIVSLRCTSYGKMCTATFYYSIIFTINGKHLAPFAAMYFTGFVFSFFFLMSYTQYQLNADIFFLCFSADFKHPLWTN